MRWAPQARWDSSLIKDEYASWHFGFRIDGLGDDMSELAEWDSFYLSHVRLWMGTKRGRIKSGNSARRRGLVPAE